MLFQRGRLEADIELVLEFDGTLQNANDKRRVAAIVTKQFIEVNSADMTELLREHGADTPMVRKYQSELIIVALKGAAQPGEAALCLLQGAALFPLSKLSGL